MKSNISFHNAKSKTRRGRCRRHPDFGNRFFRLRFFVRRTKLHSGFTRFHFIAPRQSSPAGFAWLRRRLAKAKIRNGVWRILFPNRTSGIFQTQRLFPVNQTQLPFQVAMVKVLHTAGSCNSCRFVRLRFTAAQPSRASSVYVVSIRRRTRTACPAVKKSGRGSCRIFEGWWALRDSNP